MKPALAASKQRRAPMNAPATPAAETRTPELISAQLTATPDPAHRAAMVAEAAYFYAEHRGFEPGHEMEDWLAAESQIDAALRLASTTPR